MIILHKNTVLNSNKPTVIIHTKQGISHLWNHTRRTNSREAWWFDKALASERERGELVSLAGMFVMPAFSSHIDRIEFDRLVEWQWLALLQGHTIAKDCVYHQRQESRRGGCCGCTDWPPQQQRWEHEIRLRAKGRRERRNGQNRGVRPGCHLRRWWKRGLRVLMLACASHTYAHAHTASLYI